MSESEAYERYSSGSDKLSDMPRDVEKSREIVPEVWDCREWARNSKDLQNLLGFTV